MFKTLDRYIIRAFMTNYVIAMTVMIGLYVVLDLFVNLDEFLKVRGDVPTIIARILSFYGYNMFLYFAQLAGVITLVAACFTLGRLHRTNELTAILASGTSLYRVAMPVVLTSLAMNSLWLIDQELLIPTIADKLSRKHSDIEGQNSFPVWFMRDRDNSLVSAVMYNPAQEEMRGVSVIRRNAESRMTEIIQADRGKWDRERGVWHLEGVFKQAFNEHDEGAADAVGRPRDMEYESALRPTDFALQQATLWSALVSLPDLSRMQERFKDTAVAEFIRIKHKRLTTIFINMILLCLGIPFFLNRERPSILVAGGKCLLLCGLCYVMTFMAQSIDLSVLGLPAALPAWLPVLAFGPVAALMMDSIKT